MGHVDFYAEKLILDEVEKLNNSTPDGVIVDADTILADIVEKSDMHENGVAQEIFDIWRGSYDKKSVEKIFYAFTGETFSSYLIECMKNITRAENVSLEGEYGKKCKDCASFKKDCGFANVDRRLGLDGDCVACRGFKKNLEETG